MRKSLREQMAQTANGQGDGMELDDGLTKDFHLEDLETAAELGMSQQQVKALKRRLERG